MRGDRLKEIREKRGISQRQLAAKCEIGMRQIWRYENGESEPLTSQLVKICLELAVSADYLLGLVDTQEEQFKGEELEQLQNEIIALLRKQSPLSTIRAIKLLTEHSENLEIKKEEEHQKLAKLYNEYLSESSDIEAELKKEESELIASGEYARTMEEQDQLNKDFEIEMKSFPVDDDTTGKRF